MKNIKWTTLYALAGLMLASACNKEVPQFDNPPAMEDDVVHIIATAPHDNWEATESGTPLSTRVAIAPDGTGTVENGDKLKLQIVKITPSCVFTSEFSYVVGTTKLMWSKLSPEKKAVDIIATYPPTDGFNFFEAATEVNPALLIASVKGAEYGQPITLAFRHALHRLNIVIEGLSEEELKSTKVSLKNVKSKCTLDLKEFYKLIPMSNGSNNFPTQTPKEGRCSFIVPPQKIAEGTGIVDIEVGDKHYIYKTAKETMLESGKQSTVTITVQKGGN